MPPRNGSAYVASLSSSIVAILLISGNLLSATIEVDAKCCRDRGRDRGIKQMGLDFDTEGDMELSARSRYAYRRREGQDGMVDEYVKRAATESEIYDVRTIGVLVTFAKCILQHFHSKPLDAKCCYYFPFNLDPECIGRPTRPPRPTTTSTTSTTTKKPTPTPPSNSTTTTTTTSRRPESTTFVPVPIPGSPSSTSKKPPGKAKSDEQPESETPDETTPKPSRSRHRVRKGKHGRQNQEEKPKDVGDD